MCFSLVCQVLVDELLSSVEIVNCQSVKVQVRHPSLSIKRRPLAIQAYHRPHGYRRLQVRVKVPTVAIDKTDGIVVILSKDSLEAVITTSKSSEMYVHH